MTWDETYAIAAGYSQVVANDFRLTPENPPLLGLVVTPGLKLLGAAPLDLPRGPIPAEIVPTLGTRFFFDIGNRPDLMLLISRMSVLSLTLLTMVVLIRWAARLYGPRAAWLCALLCAFEPNWIAHGHIAAWDGIATAMITLTTAALASWLVRPAPRRALLAGAALGLALAAKHSSLALGPVFALCVLANCTRDELGRYRLRNLSRARFASSAWDAALMLGAALLVLGATYNLRFDYARYLASASSIYRLNNYTFDNYLWGEYRHGLFLSYYPLALLVKTPSTSLPLLALGAVAAARAPRAELLPPLALAVVMLIVTAFDPFQIGVRHALPVLPPLILLASAGATLELRSRSFAALSLLLGGLGAAEAFAQAPYPLAFFNRLAGGPDAALRYLDYSNIDWGQDLVALAALQRRERLGDVGLFYDGTGRPSSYGVASHDVTEQELLAPEPGRLYALSLNHLHRLRHVYGAALAWLEGPPLRLAGHFIALYRAPPG